MKKYLTSLIGLALFAAITGHTSDAHAFRYRICDRPWPASDGPIKWTSIPPRMRAAGVSFPAGVWRDALTDSISRWNTNPSNFYFNLTYNEPGVGLDNGENEVWFTNDNNLLNGAPAIAYTWWSCNIFSSIKINESDVLFDSRVPYTPSTNKSSLWPYGGSSRPFQTTSSHEFGHALGLLHVNTIYNVMGQDWNHIHTNAGIARNYPGEDASNGAVFLYGLYSPPINDLSVVHWKRLGSNGEYSTHTRTQMYNTAGALLSSFNDAGEPRYRVNRGQQVQIELTYENDGAATQTVGVGYYISTNDNISTVDRLIATASYTLARDIPLTSKSTVTIPSDLALGNYYIGAIVDRTNAVSEQYENNNSAYIAIQVN
jgi:hypothetical protein